MITLQQVSDSNNGLIPRVATLAQRYTPDEVLALLMEMGESPQAAATMLAIETGQSLGHVAWASGDRADSKFEEGKIKRNNRGQFSAKDKPISARPTIVKYSPKMDQLIRDGEKIVSQLLKGTAFEGRIATVAADSTAMHQARIESRNQLANGKVTRVQAQKLEMALFSQIADLATRPGVTTACAELKKRYAAQYGLSEEAANEHLRIVETDYEIIDSRPGSVEDLYLDHVKTSHKEFVMQTGADPEVKSIIINRNLATSYYSPTRINNGRIYISAISNDPPRIGRIKGDLFHEMGHALDENIGELGEAPQQFVFDRRQTLNDKNAPKVAIDANGEQAGIHSLSKYYKHASPQYEGCIDSWTSYYVGRLYGRTLPTQIGGKPVFVPDKKVSEVFSVGLEHYSDPNRMATLLAEDPDHFFLTIGVMKAYRDRFRAYHYQGKRTDADELPETPQALEGDLADAIVEASQPIIAERIEDLQAIVNKAKGYNDLMENLPLAYDSFTRERWTQAIYEVFMRANLIGRLQVNEEIAEPERSEVVKPLNSEIAVLENSGLANNRNDAIAGYLKQPFAEAMEYLRRKVSVPTESWRSLTAEQHDIAYTIAGLTDANLLEDARWLIINAETEGLGFDEFKRMFKRLVGRKGWRPGQEPVEGAEDWRLRVAFETPVRRAISAGRNQQVQSIISQPKGLELMPGRMWLHTSTPERYRQEYPNARLPHLALHRQIFPSDHPFWAIAAPSCDYLCRCHSVLVPRWKIDKDGLTINQNPPDPKTIAGKGFRRSAGMTPKAEQRQAAAAVLPTLSPDIRQRVRRDFRKKGIL